MLSMQNFKIDDKQLKNFAKDLKIKRKSQIIAIQRGTLNDQAKATRLNAMKEQLPKMFNLRSTWLASSILVDFEKGKNPKKFKAEVGAKKRWKKNPGKDFIGLRQHELGQSISNPAINTISSRSNVFSKKVAPSKRMNKIGSLINIAVSEEVSKLRQLSSQKYKGGMKFSKSSKRFKKGIYKFSKKKFKTTAGEKTSNLEMIKDLSKTSVKLKKRPWLSKAVKRAVTPETTARFYKRNFIRYTKEKLK